MPVSAGSTAPLHLENLAEVECLGGQGLELCGLHIELGGSAAHAHYGSAFWNDRIGCFGGGQHYDFAGLAVSITYATNIGLAITVFHARKQDGFRYIEQSWGLRPVILSMREPSPCGMVLSSGSQSAARRLSVFLVSTL